MILIIDSNVFFSALIKDSTTRRIIFEASAQFLFPEYILHEFEKYKQTLLEKSDLKEDDFDILVDSILSKVKIVKKEEIIRKGKFAFNLMKNIDLKDVVFVACALSFPGSIIWSDDRQLKKQEVITVLNTAELVQVLEKLN